MVPKRKFTLSRNPFSPKSSSSFDPVPLLHIRFHDGKALQDFLENFKKRGVHLEHHVILSDFCNTLLPDAIQNRGWESLCEIPLRCPFMYILEFYSNIHDINTSVPWFATTF